VAVSRTAGAGQAWHWLLLVPLVVVLIPQVYNKARPTLFGIPFFYWYQLAVIAVGVTCTLVVYRKTRGTTRGGGS
jgi:hypothetical protein